MELASNFLRTRTASLGNLFTDVILRQNDVKSHEAPLSPNKDILISKPELIVKPEFILKPEVVVSNKSEHFLFPNKPDPVPRRKSEDPSALKSSSFAPRCLKPDVHYAQPDVVRNVETKPDVVCNVKTKPDVVKTTTIPPKPDVCAQVDEGSAKKYARKDSKEAIENPPLPHTHAHAQLPPAQLPHVQHHTQRRTQQQQYQQDRMVKERLKQHGQQSPLPDRVKPPSTPTKSKVSLVQPKSTVRAD